MISFLKRTVPFPISSACLYSSFMSHYRLSCLFLLTDYKKIATEVNKNENCSQIPYSESVCNGA